MKKIAVLNEFSIEAIRDALSKLDSFDNLVVNGLNAFQLNEIEKIDPELFAEISEKIKAEKWFPLITNFRTAILWKSYPVPTPLPAKTGLIL